MSRTTRGHVLIAGVTTRPFAVSAARAGYRVTALDAFGDVDLRAAAQVIMPRPQPGQRFGPLEAVAAGVHVRAELAVYTSNFENYPAAVTRLSRGRRLLGNAAATLARVRDPVEVMRVLQRHGLASPESRRRAPQTRSLGGSWLLKPCRSGGGHGITRWRRGTPVSRSKYLQQWIVGAPGSISFAADGATAVMLGFSRQLVGNRELGAERFRYCGSILGTQQVRLFPRQNELLERAREIADVLTREFRLVGLNGIDFIARGGVPYPLEVNPRYSASMELIERAHGISMFEVHAQACQGVLPALPSFNATIQGKAIAFARENLLVRGMPQGAAGRWLADIPHRGERIQRGRPICTVFAAAGGPEACRRKLFRRAALVYRAITALGRQAA